jgi:hypothetical protein
VLHISDGVAQKIINNHGVEPDEVRDAVVGVRGLDFAWHYHPQRGWRVIVETYIRGDPCLVVLYPVSQADPDCWRLGSAYPPNAP